MLRRFQTSLAALAIGALLLGSAAPALAYDNMTRTKDGWHEEPAPILVDAGLLRPMGIFMTVAGVALMAPVGLFTLVTRPTEIGKPWHELVVKPARFTWVDPIGSH
jgi:hypothetical protein